MPADPRIEAALAALDAAREILSLASERSPSAEPAPERPLLLRFEEAAEYIGISRTRAFELVKAAELPAVDVPGVGRRIRRSDADDFVDRLREAKP